MIPDGYRLSWARVSVVVVAVLAVVAGLIGFRAWQERADGAGSAAMEGAWFAGYVDVTATPRYAFESPKSRSGNDVVLSFVVASPNAPCEPTWGGYYDLAAAGDQIDLDRRIALLRERGGEPVVSFGGLLNAELATACTDPTRLVAAYRAVVQRYDLRTIDLDIEGDDLSDVEGGIRRAEALRALQDERERDGSPLDVWLTLPAATAGLTEEGMTAVRATLSAGVRLAGVNAMTMNYGGSREPAESMTEATRRTLVALHDQLGELEKAAALSPSGERWGRIGMTPMIGQNDVVSDVVTIAEAHSLAALGSELGVGRVSMWSLNRDQVCGVNYPTLTEVSDACSGVEQDGESFADVLAQATRSDATASPSATASATASASGAVAPSASASPSASLVDDPRTSPYQIWSPDAVYLKDTKVVWHRQAYQALRWTSGDLPDDPIAAASETPWRLLGPVLPGDRPVAKPTLKAGTYPRWSRKAVYRKGARVLVGGVPYRAKWWTQGDHPEVSETNPDASPWVALTPEEITRVAAARRAS